MGIDTVSNGISNGVVADNVAISEEDVGGDGGLSSAI